MSFLSRIAEVFGLSAEARAARREQYEVHKVRRVWLASGVTPQGDGGIWDIPNATRDEAMESIAKKIPGAVIVHIDVVHWIITYRVDPAKK